MKRILTVQDISGVGKCSVTVALPVISAMGVECAVLPTAVLSTHTQFSGFTFLDLTAEMRPIIDHWKKEGVTFDAIYTGYLGSFEQLAIVGEIIDAFRGPETTVIIDPVMGDNGRLYAGFTPEFARAMGALGARADLILPNLTEAAAMLGVPYDPAPDRAAAADLVRRLRAAGARAVALKGVAQTPGKTGVLASEGDRELFSYEHDRIPVSFHGTGDLYASVVTGALMRGLDLPAALTLACDHTAETIRATLSDPDHHDYGVNFEATFPSLLARLDRLLSL